MKTCLKVSYCQSMFFSALQQSWEPFYIPTEFPRASKGGENIPMPITFGTARISAPETPLFAGRPTLKANLPE